MKPVNLLPGDVVLPGDAGKSNLGQIGGAAAGLIAIVGVAGYFAMARVDTVKSETTAANGRAAKATTETASVRKQVESLGEPVVDSDRDLAGGAEKVFVSAYTERRDYVTFAREMRAIMDPQGWYEQIEAMSWSTADNPLVGDKTVEIIGYMPTKELAASFDERVSAQSTVSSAEITGLKSKRLIPTGGSEKGVYWRFVLRAKLKDTIAPSADIDASGVIPTNDDGTLVVDAGEPTLSLAPRPTVAPDPKKIKPVKPAKPKNPFDVAATVATQGGAS